MEIGVYASQADPGPRIWVLVYIYIYIYILAWTRHYTVTKVMLVRCNCGTVRRVGANNKVTSNNFVKENCQTKSPNNFANCLAKVDLIGHGISKVRSSWSELLTNVDLIGPC